MEGELQISKGGYSKWWEQLQRSYKNRNMYGHEVQTANYVTSHDVWFLCFLLCFVGIFASSC